MEEFILIYVSWGTCITTGKTWSTELRQSAERYHFSYTQQAEMVNLKQRETINPENPSSVTSELQQGSTSYRFHSLLKSCHQQEPTVKICEPIVIIFQSNYHSVCVWVLCTCQYRCPQSAQESGRSPGVGVADSHESPSMDAAYHTYY